MLCNDGYLRLQTKRRENLKEPTVRVTTTENDFNVSYEIAEISDEPNNINLKMKKVPVVKPKALANVQSTSQSQPTSSIVKTKDISEFAVVKTYNKNK